MHGAAYQKVAVAVVRLCRREVGPRFAETRRSLIDEEPLSIPWLRGQRPSQPGGAEPSSRVHLLPRCNLTDDEALEQLEFNLLWHHALRLDIEETQAIRRPSTTSEVRLMQHDGGRLASRRPRTGSSRRLGIRTGKQRLDSTHIRATSHTLRPDGLFCETMRCSCGPCPGSTESFGAWGSGGPSGRYLKEEDEATHYEDPARGRLGDALRSVARASTGWWTGPMARLLGWRSTGCGAICCGSSAMWAAQDGIIPWDDDDDVGNARCPWP